MVMLYFSSKSSCRGSESPQILHFLILRHFYDGLYALLIDSSSPELHLGQLPERTLDFQ